MVSANYFDHSKRMEKDSRSVSRRILRNLDIDRNASNSCKEGGRTTDHGKDLLKQFKLLNRHKVCDRPGSKEEYPLLNVRFFVNEDAALLQGAEYKVMRTSLRKRMRPKACSL